MFLNLGIAIVLGQNDSNKTMVTISVIGKLNIYIYISTTINFQIQLEKH